MKLHTGIVFAFLFCGFIFICDNCIGQTKQQTNDCPGFQDTILHKLVYKFGEQTPAPIGGSERLCSEIAHTLNYTGVPGVLPGRIIVAFVVERNGKIDGERVIKAPYKFDDPSHLSEQIFSIVRSVKWRPGKCHHRKVAMLYALPITLEFSDGE